MQDERAVFQNRLRDLAKRSYAQNIYTFTEFLTLEEQSLALGMERELGYAGVSFFGGMPDAERRMIRFGSPDAFGYEEEFPIACMRITPVSEKFADALNHRDYLGALMHQGIERSVLGDILMRDMCAYVFCTDTIVGYLTEHVTRIRHTNVLCERMKEFPAESPADLKRIECIVPSLRCDVLIAKVFHLSRSAGAELFRAQKVFVNGRQVINGGTTLKEEDRVSVRGYGKFICRGTVRMTKKGNLRVAIDLYV